MSPHNQKRNTLRQRFEEKGFVVHDGLKYGVDLLLYTDLPSRVHSKYGVLIYRNHNFLDLISAQRTCSSANKTLVVAFFEEKEFRLVAFERVVFKDGDDV